MGDVTGFKKYTREDFPKEPVKERLNHWSEFHIHLPEEKLKLQGARCMDCGVPFCQSGCPIGNIIPDWNDLVYKNDYKSALERLLRTNNFPEFTGRICPAPCEDSCVLAINDKAVTIKNIEVSIIEKGYSEGWIKPNPPKNRTGKTVAIIGSGPAGLSCADQLNKSGHSVTVYEKNEVPGGLLTLGIPDFKLEKSVVQRRINIMKEEGIVFKTGVNVGKDISAKELKNKYDILVLAGGAENPNDLKIPGRDLEGTYFAMEYLTQQNRLNMNLDIKNKKVISAKGKNVIVLGGGDTGSDCIGTANRQGAKSIRQLELLSEPPSLRNPENPWPQWAYIKRTSTSQEEGVERDYAVMTKKLSGENNILKKLHGVRLEFGEKDPKTGRPAMKEILGSEFELECDLLLLAMGFQGPVKNGMIEELGIELTERGNVKTNINKMTNIEGVFSCGDMARGQSLVVWAINEGRTTATSINQFLANVSTPSR